ncbi:GntR family transcriptional regulator [Glaciibacter sp. 2TAF33]|uniref:GntR family transcriptional regulator n=1 Tax=Glaciibacter sp. 2TAF33 TaxID=3233015 RepID=UPI003F932813
MAFDAVTSELSSAAKPVDRKLPLPAWAQVERDMRSLIDQGLEIGSQLPPENELAAIYGVSRITVRQALSSLSDHGYVERRQGTGTFVADRPQLIQHDFGLTEPWRDRFQAAGHRAESRQLSEEPIEAEPYELARYLPESERDLNRVHFKRLHLVNDRPIGLTDSWVVSGVAPLKVKSKLIDGSLSKTLTHHGVTAARIDHFLEVRIINSQEAELLQTNLDAPLFVDWSASRLPDGSLIETSRTVWLATRVRFHYVSGVD